LNIIKTALKNQKQNQIVNPNCAKKNWIEPRLVNCRPQLGFFNALWFTSVFFKSCYSDKIKEVQCSIFTSGIILTNRTTLCTKAPAYAESRKVSHHLVYCTQPYPVFYTRAISRAWTRDFPVTWQQLYQLCQGFPSSIILTNTNHKINHTIDCFKWNKQKYRLYSQCASFA